MTKKKPTPRKKAGRKNKSVGKKAQDIVRPAKSFKLSLTLDARQITQALQYEFLEMPHRKQCKRIRNGALGGTFHFYRGDDISIELNVTDSFLDTIPLDKSLYPQLKISVVNCTLVSICPPNSGALSIFDEHSACLSINEWSIPKLINSKYNRDNDIKQMRIEALRPAFVAVENGQWKLSGYLSLQFETNGVTKSRLFFFDPESSSGEGGLGGD